MTLTATSLFRRCCHGAEDSHDNSKRRILWARWRRMLVAVVLSFLCNVENGMLASGEWPYMSTIDHEATSQFYGLVTSLNKAAHVLFSFIFAFCAFKMSSIKIPMLIGRGITLVGCVMYIFVEFIPSNRRYWMLVCYLLFGIGFGTSPLLRSYIVLTTTEDNRSSGYALLNGANVLSMMVGPIAQLCFSGLPYPGVDIIPPHIKLNIYSAPIWFSVITNVVAIVITALWLKDVVHVEERQGTDGDEPLFRLSLASIRDQFARLRSLNLPWLLVALVLLEKMVSGLFNSTMAATIGPMMTTMYAYEGAQMVVILGVSQIMVGLLAVCFSLTFIGCKIGKRVSCRVLFAFSNILMIAGYIITYPYPFSSSPMQPFNETTRTGCDSAEYSWCDTQLVVNIVPFIVIMVVLSSFAIPAASMSLDTIYSKIIGNIDQNMMQSFFVVAEDVVMIVAPLYGTSIYSAIGFNYLEIINCCIYITGTVLWFAAWKWLQPFQ